MKRIVQPELLDQLPPNDPRAVRSRGDLRRINAWMGNARVVASSLREFQRPPSRIVELGAGDGEFLLCVVRRLPRPEREAVVTLVDQQAIVSSATQRGFESKGWQVEIVTANVFDWLGQSSEIHACAFVTNLFLHHFADNQLRELLSAVSRRAKFFVACEPKRSSFSLAFSRLLWLIGCNAVTRHDAVVSVRAGFAGSELSALWPEHNGWNISESRAGLFSHRFVARRSGN